MQFSGTLASTRELIAEAGVSGEVTGDGESALSSHSCVSFLLEWLRFWLRDEVSAKCCMHHGAFPCHRAPSNK